MENKEKVLEGIRQSSYKISQLEAELASTKEQLNALKSELDKADTVEVAADGAILVAGKRGSYITGAGKLGSATTLNDDVKYLTSYATEEQAQDEVLRREIDCYIRSEACIKNDNHNWKKINNRYQSHILMGYGGDGILKFATTDSATFAERTSYFNKDKDAQAVADELNAKYSPEIIKRLYYA